MFEHDPAACKGSKSVKTTNMLGSVELSLRFKQIRYDMIRYV